jgi:hypothetical protein
MATRAYANLARYLVALHRRDLLTPLASALAAMARLAILIEVAQREADDANATRLRAESLKQRAAFEHGVHRVVEVICDEQPDGADLVAALLGDGGRLLADELLGDED